MLSFFFDASAGLKFGLRLHLTGWQAKVPEQGPKARCLALELAGKATEQGKLEELIGAPPSTCV